jgi:hypothetical protein
MEEIFFGIPVKNIDVPGSPYIPVECDGITADDDIFNTLIV